LEIKDYYRILGIHRNVTQNEIRVAFGVLALTYHPSSVRGASATREKFKELCEAYDILSNPQKRAEYDEAWKNYQTMEQKKGHWSRTPSDHTHPEPVQNTLPSYDHVPHISEERVENPPARLPLYKAEVFSDIRLKYGEQDIRTQVEITATDSVRGGCYELQLCNLLQFPEQAATYTIQMPHTIARNSILKVPGLGYRDISTGRSGDLFLKVKIINDDRFTLKSGHAHCALILMPWDLALGGEFTLEGLEGPISLEIPQGYKGGSQIRIPEKGIYLTSEKRSDLLVQLSVAVPTTTDPSMRAIWQQLANIYQAENTHRH